MAESIPKLPSPTKKFEGRRGTSQLKNKISFNNFVNRQLMTPDDEARQRALRRERNARRASIAETRVRQLLQEEEAKAANGDHSSGQLRSSTGYGFRNSSDSSQ